MRQVDPPPAGSPLMTRAAMGAGARGPLRSGLYPRNRIPRTSRRRKLERETRHVGRVGLAKPRCPRSRNPPMRQRTAAGWARRTPRHRSRSPPGPQVRPPPRHAARGRVEGLPPHRPTSRRGTPTTRTEGCFTCLSRSPGGGHW